MLRVINAGLEADFDPDAFEHVAFFSEADAWIEMRLRANGAQTVRIDGADLEVTFADGEEIRTEISAKFTREAVERELHAAGLRLDDFFTDGGAPLRAGLRVAALGCPPRWSSTASARWSPAEPRASGEATARELAARGARVAIADLNEERGPRAGRGARRRCSPRPT